MALKVGELYATMSLDRSAFDRDVDGAGRRFDGLRSTIGSATRAMATAVVGVATATAALGAAALRVGLDYNRMQQSSRAALLTLLGSAEAVNEQMGKLDEFARQSPFAKDIFIRGQQQLIAFGVEVEKVIPALDAMQNAVAAAGGSGQQLSELISIFAKISAAGKLTAQDFIEFGNRGIDAASLIGRALGTTGAEVRAMVTAGTLDVNTALDALVQGTLDRFGGATALIKRQFDGARDRVKAAFRDVGSIIAAPFIDPQGGGRAVVWANLLADGLRDLEQKAKPLVDLLVNRFGPGLDRMVVGPLERARAAINGWDLREVNGQIDRLAKYGPLVASTSAAIFALGSNGLVLSRLGLSLNPVVAGIAALVAASPELRAMGREVLGALSPLIPVARDLGRQVADTAMAVLAELTPGLRDLLLAAAPVAVALGESLGGALQALLPLLVPIAEALGDVASLIAELPTPVIAAAAAFVLLRTPVTTFAGLVGGLPTTLATAKTAVVGLATAMKTAFIGNPVGLALTAIAGVVALFADQQAKARQRVTDLRDSLDQQTAAVTENTRAVAFNRLEQGGYIEAAVRQGVALDGLVDAALGSEDAQARLAAATRDAQAALDAELESMGWSPRAAELRDRLADLDGIQGAVGGTARDLADAQERVRLAAEAGIGATDGATAAIEGQNSALRDNISLQDEAAGRALSLREAQLRAADGTDRVNDAIARYGEVSRDANATDADKAAAFRDIEEALVANVRDYQNVQDAMARNNATGRELWETVKAQREAFIEQAVATGVSREAAEALADQYGLIPDEIVTKLIADTAAANRALSTFMTTWNGKSIRINVQSNGILTPTVTFTSGNANGAIVDAVRRFAGGGFAGGGQYVPRVPQVAAGGRNIMWAEPETGWEAYISGKPSMRARNLGVLAEAADRLGFMVLPKASRGYADGYVTPVPAAPAPAFPETVRLDRESVVAVAEAIVAGSQRVALGVVDGRDRAAAGARTTQGRAY